MKKKYALFDKSETGVLITQNKEKVITRIAQQPERYTLRITYESGATRIYRDAVIISGHVYGKAQGI